MISKNVLAKGQIVIPKTIRDLMGINVGDEMIIDIDDRKIILSKKENLTDVFTEVAYSNSKKISVKEIKTILMSRYEED